MHILGIVAVFFSKYKMYIRWPFYLNKILTALIFDFSRDFFEMNLFVRRSGILTDTDAKLCKKVDKK